MLKKVRNIVGYSGVIGLLALLDTKNPANTEVYIPSNPFLTDVVCKTGQKGEGDSFFHLELIPKPQHLCYYNLVISHVKIHYHPVTLGVKGW
jgi:hypothetical protein